MSMAIIGVAGVVVGAGAGIYSATQAGKGSGQSRSLSELNQLPYGQQLGNAKDWANAQLGMDKDWANYMLQIGPNFAAQQLDYQKNAAQAALGLYPQFAAAERNATSATRGADLSDLGKYGAGYVDQFANASPGFGALVNRVNQGNTVSPTLGLLNYNSLTAGTSPIGQELQNQALSDLALGRSLSPDQQRDAEQSARGAFASRGLGMSNAAIGSEILSRDDYATQMQNQRRGFAQNTMGLLDNEQEANRRFQLNVEGLNTGENQAWQNFLLGAAGQTSQPLYAEMNDRAPASNWSAVMGGMGLGMPIGATNQMMSGAPSVYQGAQAMTPLYNYGADVFNTNFNTGESRAMAQANGYAAIGGGLMSLGGKMGGAGMGYM